MFENQTYINTANWQITNGMTVYATDGTKLGSVRNYNPQDGYLDVHKGLVFTKDFFVPLSAVDAVTEDGITLQLTKEDLNDERYSSPPAATATNSGMASAAGTMPETEKWSDTGETAIPGETTVDTLTAGRGGDAR